MGQALALPAAYSHTAVTTLHARHRELCKITWRSQTSSNEAHRSPLGARRLAKVLLRSATNMHFRSLPFHNRSPALHLFRFSFANTRAPLNHLSQPVTAQAPPGRTLHFSLHPTPHPLASAANCPLPCPLRRHSRGQFAAGGTLPRRPPPAASPRIKHSRASRLSAHDVFRPHTRARARRAGAEAWRLLAPTPAPVAAAAGGGA